MLFPKRNLFAHSQFETSPSSTVMIQKRSNKFAGFFALPSITAKHYLLSIEKSVLLDYVCSKLSLADRSSSVFCFTTLWPLAYFRPSPGLRLPLCGTRIRRRRRLQAASRFHFHSIYVAMTDTTLKRDKFLSVPKALLTGCRD